MEANINDRCRKNLKYLNKSSLYKHVYLYITDKKVIRFKGMFGKKQKYFKTEKEVAKFADLKLIEQGKEPVNILIRKSHEK
jgi:hypothetical protein